jgi:sRNA-binding regulator protein Hfq
MKDSLDSTAVKRAPDPEGFANRKLIRPVLPRDHRSSDSSVERREPRPHHNNSKKASPPEQTHAENFYYQKQMQSHTPMTIVLQDGEAIHGVIEWYDKSCIKVTRAGNANMLIYKSSIKYLYKQGEERK